MKELVKPTVEAALMCAGEPLSIDRLQSLFDEAEGKPAAKLIREVLAELKAEYADRAIELVEVASGFRFQVKINYAKPIKKLLQKQSPRYSRAVMETLAIIAYKQPVTRAEIEAIRGVAVNTQIIKTLQDRGWVQILGYKDLPGKPGILGTTKEFLDDFNLRSLEELPPLLQFTEVEDLQEVSGAKVAVSVDAIKEETEVDA